VDLASQRAFASALDVLARRGATIVLVAHELGPIAPLIGRTVVMRDGRVAYDGLPSAESHEPEHHHGHHHPDQGTHGSDYIPAISAPIGGPNRGSRS